MSQKYQSTRAGVLAVEPMEEEVRRIDGRYKKIKTMESSEEARRFFLRRSNKIRRNRRVTYTTSRRSRKRFC